MSRVFISDLDHTLLKSDLSISEFTKDIWNGVAKDSIMSIATARTYKKAMQFVSKLEINSAMVLLDGSLIATKDGKIIQTRFIEKSLADEIIAIGSKHNIYPFLLSLEDKKSLREIFSYSSTLNYHQKEVLKNYKNDDHHNKQTDLRALADNFKIVYFGEKDSIEPLYLELVAIFGDELKFIFAPEAYVGCYFLTILHKDATKAKGILSLQDEAHFELENLSVFGDNLNDLEMFELANTSIAVANAHEMLKQKADIILPHTNDEDGVARYLSDEK